MLPTEELNCFNEHIEAGKKGERDRKELCAIIPCVTETNKTNLFANGKKEEKRHFTNYCCLLECTYYRAE